MSTIKTQVSGNFSYLVNNKLVNSDMNSIFLFIDILTDDVIRMNLEPKSIKNAQIYTPYKFTLTAENITNETIEKLNLKLNADKNLKYVADSLVNRLTGRYYAGKNWREDYCNIEPLLPNETIVLDFYMEVYPSSEYYPSEKLLAYNSTSTSLDKSNDTFTTISEEKISISISNDRKEIYIENMGTIESDNFIYKYLIPSNTNYKSALLNGEKFNNISYSQLGSYAIFKIGSIPVSTKDIPKILTISFS